MDNCYRGKRNISDVVLAGPTVGTCNSNENHIMTGTLYRGYYVNRLTDVDLGDPLYDSDQCTDALLLHNRDYIGWTRQNPSLPCQPILQEHQPQDFIYDDDALTCMFSAYFSFRHYAASKSRKLYR